MALPWLLGAHVALWLLAPQSAWLWIAAVSALAAALAWLARRAWPLWVALGTAWSWLAVDTRLDERLAPTLAGQDISISGWIDDFPRERAGQVSFSFSVAASPPERALPSRLRLTWYDAPVELRAGRSYELIVRLKRPHGLVNPGGFDFERWLFLEGYGATGYVRSGNEAATRSGGIARAWLERRAAIASRIGAEVEQPDARALLTALALGERFEFSDEHWATFRRTGTSHLVAISGLHVGIVSALLFVVTRRLWLRGPAAVAPYDLEAAALVSLVGAAVYAALAGFSVPTQRALIMLAVALAGLVTRRSTTMTAGLSVAVLFVLVWDPLAPLSASFWLSFVAVALLWQLASARTVGNTAAPRAWLSVCSAARIQWGIALGLVPIVVLSFGELSLVTPVVNFVAIPLFSFVLVPLTLLATVALAVEPVGTLLLGVAATLAERVYAALAALAEPAWAALPTPAPDVPAAALLCTAAVLALPVHALPGRYLAVCAALSALLARPAPPAVGALEAIVLDVGHGLAVVLRTRGHSLLFDTGARYRSGFDSGEEIVLPALRQLGARELDMIIVSHADNDHAGGLESIVEAYPRAMVLAGPDLDLAHARPCRSGLQWEWDGVQFAIAHPPDSFPALGNDSSCVLKVEVGNRALLLTGDLERRGERALVASGQDLRADVVVVPHHGSATSSSSALIAATRPGYAVVSAGYANQWGFPKSEVVARWAQVGAATIVTGESGAVTLHFSPDDALELSTRRANSRRPWRSDPSRS